MTGAAGLTATNSVAVAAALVSPSASFSVAVAVSVKLASFVGVIVSESVQALTSIASVSPAETCEWPWPSLNSAPAGAPLMVSAARLLLSPSDR
jgi:hypothetical protein